MHNPYLKELFTEGLGDIFFMKYYRFIKNKIKNKFVQEVLISIHVILYLLFLIIVGCVLFKISFPL